MSLSQALNQFAQNLGRYPRMAEEGYGDWISVVDGDEQA